MRNPLKRLARRDAPKVPLRARLDAVKARLAASKVKVGRIVRVNRVLLADTSHIKPAAPPPVERAALVNYASWLFMERRLVCMELYPHMGWRADTFVLDAPPADAFHFPPGGDWRNVPKPSTRATKILGMLGIDWRGERDSDLGISDLRDNGARPKLPHDWPRVDAGLLEALDDLNRLDAAQGAIHTAGRPDREGDTVPGYDALEEARTGALAQLAKVRAISRTGLQAKSRAILTRTVRDQGTSPAGVNAWSDIASSLARDLLGASNRTLEPTPDPIFAVIEENRRLNAEWSAMLALPHGDGPRSDALAAQAAFAAHTETTLLTTAPRTAEGCKALARYAAEYAKHEGFSLDENEDCTDHLRILDLIARSPLL